MPVEARGAAPAVIADVEVGNLLFDIGGLAEAEANFVDTRDVDQPDAVARSEVVDGLGVERIQHRHAAKSHVVCEQVEEASARRHHPRPLSAARCGTDGPFENRAGAGKAERRPAAKLLAVALALRHLQHARRPVDERGRIAAGEEGHILQELGIEQAHGTAGRREVGERIDVGNLDVVHDEEVLERTAAADDDVVAEIVGTDDDARQTLHVARHVLQGSGALEDLAWGHQKPRVLHRLGRPELRRRHGHRLLEVGCRGQRDLHGAVEPGAHIHGVAGEGQTGEGQNLQPVSSGTQITDPKGAASVACSAGVRIERTYAHCLGRVTRGVHDDASDRPHAGGVLCRRRRAEKDQQDR